MTMRGARTKTRASRGGSAGASGATRRLASRLEGAGNARGEGSGLRGAGSARGDGGDAAVRPSRLPLQHEERPCTRRRRPSLSIQHSTHVGGAKKGGPRLVGSSAASARAKRLAWSGRVVVKDASTSSGRCG
eukprot:368217-Rhodomonas_salina.8